MATPKLFGISGSLRKDSHNTLLLAEAARLFGDADYTLADIRLPLYDEDDEKANGVPDAVQTLAQQIADADAVLISTPEYNKGPSARSRTRSIGSAGRRSSPGGTSPWR